MNRAATNDGSPSPAVRTLADDVAKPFWRSLWEHWKQIARAIGVMQTKLLMVLFYFVMVLPLGLIVRRRDDRLRLKPPDGSLWIPHPNHEHTLDRARKQY
ncbi:MAG: hypothetical protein N3C12_15710 [Candidatus Binatia bacterium]|nr:hypothetical protein [Candidatus Binatia bacterium]